jgi:hypothetical protein
MARPRLLLTAMLALAPFQAGSARPADPEAKLARALEGRVAGEPVDCINLHNIRSSTIIDRTAILYEASGGTIYVNRPDGGESSLGSWDILVTNTHSSQLCNIDVVHLYDSGARMQTGVVFLGDFVPYKRPKALSSR